ncbi:MAG: replication initiation protein [Pseudomonadota bacterium]
MLIQEEQGKDLTLHKPTAITHMRNDFTVAEHKLFNSMMFHAQSDGLRKDVYRVPVVDLFHWNGSESRNYKWIKEVARGLHRKDSVELNVLGKDKRQIWKIQHLFGQFQFDGEFFEFSFNATLMKELRSSDLYGRFFFLIQMRMRRSYSIRLYEALVDKICRSGNQETVEVEFGVDELRSLLLDKVGSTYAQFKRFKDKILSPAVEEINATSQLFVVMETIKNGNKIVRVKFIASHNEAYQMSLDLGDIEDTLGRSVKKVEALEHGDNENQLLFLLTDQGISPTGAKKY